MSSAPHAGPRLCIVCPCHNEAEGIDAFADALFKELDALTPAMAAHVICVDDGSTDATFDRLQALSAKEPRLLAYALSRNFGHQIALSAGLDMADADAVILMDSDLQHPPALIPKLLAAWRAGHDIVSAVRTDTRDAGLFKRVSSRAFYTLFNMLSEVKLVPGVADFTLLSARARDALQRMPERHRFLRGLLSWTGMPRALVPYEAAARGAGQSSYTPRRMVRMAMDAVLSFSARPLRMATKFGLLVACGGFAYLLYVVTRAVLVGDTEPGWPSLLSAILILGGLQLAVIGLVGEYIARVFEEVKGRPLYLLRSAPDAARIERARHGGSR